MIDDMRSNGCELSMEVTDDSQKKFGDFQQKKEWPQEDNECHKVSHGLEERAPPDD